MIVACTIVSIWVVAYIAKQLLLAENRFGGAPGNTGRCMSLCSPCDSILCDE